jgi:hypothetical protein
VVFPLLETGTTFGDMTRIQRNVEHSNVEIEWSGIQAAARGDVLVQNRPDGCGSIPLNGFKLENNFLKLTFILMIYLVNLNVEGKLCLGERKSSAVFC